MMKGYFAVKEFVCMALSIAQKVHCSKSIPIIQDAHFSILFPHLSGFLT